ncbi:MAG: DUF11 domain-containing protein [Ruminococcaceae bacterium]|nr:DUF11 domain-containing protein [Oscillospiraceae bacterium]
MAQIITNQASLVYQFNGQTASALSNVATTTLVEPLSVSKNSLETTYGANDELTFIVSFTNSGATALTNVSVVDDLGTYALGTNSVTPLTFVPNAVLFINGVFSGNIVPTQNANSVTFTVPSLPAGANAQIVYNTRINDGAPIDVDSAVTNTVSVTADQISTPVTDSNTVTAAEFANVEITKSMSPSNVVDGGPITYTFTLYNYGNAQATDIVLTDAFDPAPSNITVQIDGVTVAPTDYSYVGGTLTLPTGTALDISLPAATITQDPTTGIVTVTPSTTVITVTGTI